MITLDLFCGAGRASKGIADVGFEVIGVDSTPGLNHPGEYLVKQVLK